MSAALLQGWLVVAQSPSSSGDDASELGGILIIVGVVIAAVVLGFVAHYLVHRLGRTRPEVSERHPHEPGRVGRGEDVDPS